VYQPPATEAWLNVSDAAAFVQGMLPSTCRVVVAEAVLLPRRVRGLLPPTAAENLLSKEAAPQDDKGEAPVARLGNLGRQSRVFTKKRTRPIVKAREARKRRQVKALLASDPPATFGIDNPPDPPQTANNTTPKESNLNGGVSAYTSPGLGTH
jgi:hypothetical protein